MIRSFEVRARSSVEVCYLAEKLDKKLIELQEDGWTIISIFNTPCEEFEYPKNFDSILFTIVAQHE